MSAAATPYPADKNKTIISKTLLFNTKHANYDVSLNGTTSIAPLPYPRLIWSVKRTPQTHDLHKLLL